MIKMIKGTYGRVVDGTVEAMTSRSAPFSLSEAREAELIAAGVAEKVEAPAKADTYGNMKMTELRKAAAALGVDASAAKNKKEVIALIEAAQARAKTGEATEE
ncbi:MAG: response regulator receiver protein [Lachnospiraceae bacterium]|nr:response regulator receiver protein [Lachnospiraceae bacterium]